jgi:glycosyltransferase involved in cell wall biosynthesis
VIPTLSHDYLTQRGGAERVVSIMTRAFPHSPLHTLLYEQAATFPEFRDVDVRASGLNGYHVLRNHHRVAMPLLRRAVENTVVEGSVLLASSSGWAHGIRAPGRKIVYCHTPARWLYQSAKYVGRTHGHHPRDWARRAAWSGAIGMLGPSLRAWDARQAATADRYLVNSTVTQRAVKEIYDIDAEILPPPVSLPADGPVTEVPGIRNPFLLCVARLLPYKNVDVVVEAARAAGIYDLVVVGEGPERSRLLDLAHRWNRVHLLDRVEDDQLRWLYGNCTALVTASYGDYGLTPLEAAAFGRPTIALHAGGFLDTVASGVSGHFFEEPTVASLASAITEFSQRSWDPVAITRHGERFSEARFVRRLQEVVAEEMAAPLRATAVEPVLRRLRTPQVVGLGDEVAL